ncbi:MAG: NACHT domain-containing protein [Caldilineaceae bacterium]|nr:NACHT domain-containing protein [Caldilineaceae bacterium]
MGVALDALTSAAAPLSTYEIMRQHTQFVLLGDPGSGKSTLTRRIASALAAVAQPNQTGQAETWSAALNAAFPRWLLPVRVVLSTWANHLSPNSEGTATDLIDESVHILAQTAKVDDNAMQKRFLVRLSGSEPSVLLLLDGLDEVADVDKRRKLLASVRRFCQHYGDVPLIITCRARPYTEGEHYRLPLPDFEIGPLPQPAIRAFVERWHAELAWAGLYTEAAAASARQRLLTALDDPNRHELREMAETPLLLTMMARVNYKRGLPNSRAKLYEEYVKQLLYEWERAKLDEQGKRRGWICCCKRAASLPPVWIGRWTNWPTGFTARAAAATLWTSPAVTCAMRWKPFTPAARTKRQRGPCACCAS